MQIFYQKFFCDKNFSFNLHKTRSISIALMAFYNKIAVKIIAATAKFITSEQKFSIFFCKGAE